MRLRNSFLPNIFFISSFPVFSVLNPLESSSPCTSVRAGHLVTWSTPAILFSLRCNYSRKGQLQILHPLGSGGALRFLEFLRMKCPWNKLCVLTLRVYFSISLVSYYENILNISLSTLLRLLIYPPPISIADWGPLVEVPKRGWVWGLHREKANPSTKGLQCDKEWVDERQEWRFQNVSLKFSPCSRHWNFTFLIWFSRSKK